MSIYTGANANIATGANNETVIIAPEATADTLRANHAGAALINYGTIGGVGVLEAVVLSAPCQFTNRPDGVVLSHFSPMVVNTSAEVNNEGLLMSVGSDGIVVHSANNDRIVNSGDIYGARSGIRVDAPTAFNVAIDNSGEIRSDQNGIWLLNAAGAAPVIVNSGTIIGRLNSILAEFGDRLNVTNSGLLSGSVTATSTNQSDRLINNGTVAGNVSLGSGADLYQGSGRVSGFVFGQGGVDTHTGGAFADRFDGGSENDTLTGNAGNDILRGSSGNDRLLGGLGRDTLTGGGNVDLFIFNTAPNTANNRDALVDFSRADDTLQFENAVFTKLGAAGILNAQFLRLGAAPLDANDYLIYNKASGVLTYDVNGNGVGGAQQVAVLTTKPTLALGDFVVI